MSRRPLVAAVVLLALAMVSTPAAAQSRFEFTPFVGAYIPTKPVVADTALGSTSIFEVTSGPVFGGRLTYRIGQRFALEGSGAMASSKFNLVAAGGTTQQLEFRASTFMADIRGLLLVTSPGAPTALHVMAGAGITHSNNSLFQLADETQDFKYETSIGPVVGLGLSRRIASGVNLRIDMEDRIYQAHVESFGTNTDERTQHDLVFSAGLAFGF